MNNDANQTKTNLQTERQKTEAYLWAIIKVVLSEVRDHRNASGDMGAVSVFYGPHQPIGAVVLPVTQYQHAPAGYTNSGFSVKAHLTDEQNGKLMRDAMGRWPILPIEL